MRYFRRPGLRALWVATLALMALLSGCGATSIASHGGGISPRGSRSTSTAAGVSIVTATPTTSPPASPTATSTTPATTAPGGTSAAQLVVQQGCPDVPVHGGGQPQYVAAGGLAVSVPSRLLDYPSEFLPDNLPNAPHEIPANSVQPYTPNPPVNPSLATGYGLEICNKSNTSHTLSGITATIASFTPSSGTDAIWNLCHGPYVTAYKSAIGGCGGGLGVPLTPLTATFSVDSSGASATVSGGSWPATLRPNTAVLFRFAVQGATRQGTYTLSFGVRVDGAAPVQIKPSDGLFFIAASPATWTGTACMNTPAMLARIPSSSQQRYYVCPPSSH